MVLQLITKNFEDGVATTTTWSHEYVSWNGTASGFPFTLYNRLIFFFNSSVRDLQFQHCLVLKIMIMEGLCISEELKTFSCLSHAILFLTTSAQSISTDSQS